MLKSIKELGYYHAENAPEVHLVGGHLYLDNQIIPDVKWDRNIATWYHGISKTELSSGVLQFAPDRSWFSGHVSKCNLAASKPDEASEGTTNITLRGTVKPTVFNCEVSVQSFANKDDALNASTDSKTAFLSEGVPPIAFGPVWDDSLDGVRWGFEIAGVDWRDNIAVSYDNEMNANITLVFNPDDMDAMHTVYPQYTLAPADGKFTIHWDGKYLWGYVQVSVDGQYYAFKGTVQDSVLRAQFCATMRHTPYKTVEIDDEPVTTENLRNLTVSDVELQNRVNELMVIAMKYSMPDKLREDIFAEIKPDISLIPYMADAIKSPDGQQFYGTDFLYPFLGTTLNSMTGVGSPKRKMTPEETKKVQFYLSSTLASNSNYNIQNKFAYQQAWVDCQPRIKEYTTSPEAAKIWGEKLFLKLQDDDAINMVSNQILFTNDYSYAKRYSLLLQILGCDDYAAQWGQALSANMMIKSVNQVSSNAIAGIYSDCLAKFVQEYDTDPGANAPKDELEKFATAEAIKEASEEFDSIGALGAAVSDLLVAVRNKNQALAESMDSVVANLVQKFPKVQKLGSALDKLSKGLMVVAWCAGMFSIITGYSNWRNQPTANQVALVTRTVQMGGELLSALPDMGKAIKAAGGGYLWEKMSGNLFPILRKISAWMGSTRVGQWFSDCMTWTWETVQGPKFVNWAKSLADWFSENVFRKVGNLIDVQTLDELYIMGEKALKNFMKALGPLVAAAAAAQCLYTFITELLKGKTPKVQEALDGALAVLATLELIVTIALLSVESVCLTAVGVILAVAAVIITLIEVFRPPKPPPSPVEVFMAKIFYPWVDKLPDPDPSWQLPSTPPPSSSS